MTTDDIERAARAGFNRYYMRRPWYRYDTAPFPVVKRWAIVAARVLNGQVTRPEQLRDAYCDGIDGAPAWSVKQALMWREVLHAIQRAGTQAVAA